MIYGYLLLNQNQIAKLFLSQVPAFNGPIEQRGLITVIHVAS